MEPKYVTFEQSKWLFEKDYPPIPKCFNKEGEERTVSVVISRLTESTYYPRPEQHQVVEWLIVNHDIWVSCYPTSNPLKCQFRIYKNDNGVMGQVYDHYMGKEFNSPQKAYSAAFDYIKDNNLI